MKYFINETYIKLLWMSRADRKDRIKIPRCYEFKWLSFQLYDDMLILRVYISSYEL